MKDIGIEVKRRSGEICIVEVSASLDDGTTARREIDFSGNAITSALWGAMEVIRTLREMQPASGAESLNE